jgi:hypothetical protein
LFCSSRWKRDVRRSSSFSHSSCGTDRNSKIHFNIILPPAPRSHKWSLRLRCSNQNFVCTYSSPNAFCMFAHPFWFSCPNKTAWRA